MKKITLVVLDRERKQALSELRKLGVLHVEGRAAASEDMESLKNLRDRLTVAESFLGDFPPARNAPRAELLNRKDTLALVDTVFSLKDERRSAQDTLARVTREAERLAAWGDVDPAQLRELSGKGLHLHPFEMSAQDYANVPDYIRSVTVNRDKRAVRCLVLSEDGRAPADLPMSARELSLPDASSADMRREAEAASRRIPETAAKLSELAVHAPSIVALRGEICKELEFETVRAGMPLVSFDGESPTAGSTSVAWLTGFIPEPREAELSAAAKAHGWAYLSSEPAEDDNVPTELRNNRLVNIISPLLDFLGTVPGYRELDISVWFLLFFGIFFAMIFGDGGYGALLVLMAGYGIVSSVAKRKKVPTAMFMLLYLGAMTVAWGTITCTWFGIPTASLPPFLLSISLPAFSNANPDSALNIKIFCFTLGLVQISLAHVIGIIRNRGSLKLLGEIGALVLAIGMYFVVLNLVVDADRFPLTNLVLGMVIGGFLLNFVFINYSGSIGGGLLESVKNIITMILGVVNMFGDIMSYIRLWAVGLAGSAISSTINTMAGPMLGGFIIFAGVILLLFGHGLNTVMNVLSVLVHGVRLNTLEFSNHLGLTWSGFKYEPFSETVNK